jgi:hypothetical protein
MNTTATLIWVSYSELLHLADTLTANQAHTVVSWMNPKNKFGVYIYTKIAVH